MTDTLQFIANKYNLNLNQKEQPIEIPNTTRNTFAELLAELSMNVGAEVGVERGIYSEVLLKANQHLTLYSIDAWTAYEGYRDHMTQPEMDVLLEQTKARLGIFGSRSIIIKGFSTDVANDITDGSLDFVYLDGNHEFTQVVNDIAAWERKVRVGGIIFGHDYIKRKGAEYQMHVPWAVHGYMGAYDIKPLFVLGRKAAKSNTDPSKGELRESTRSWFYVKPERAPMKPGWKPTS